MKPVRHEVVVALNTSKHASNKHGKVKPRYRDDIGLKLEKMSTQCRQRRINTIVRLELEDSIHIKFNLLT